MLELYNIEFANKGLLYLLVLIVPMVVWYVLRQKKANAHLHVSSLSAFANQKVTYKHYLKHLLFVFRILAIALIIVALARPQSTDTWKNITTEGIDIILSLDISSSMLAEDFSPNRLEAAKNVAKDFISGRPNDRMGLVVFSGESFTQCPLTTDHAVLINLFRDIKSGMIEDGTAIGMGLANAVTRIKDSETKSKVIILLTDGVNNQGDITPLTAAEIAKTYGIRVYTIGVGTMGKAPYPFKTPFGTQYQNIDVDIDENTLTEIAEQTGGEYFRATNNKSLKEIYKEIDKLEKSKIDVQEMRKKDERFFFFVLLASILLFTEILLKNTIFRTIP